MLVRQRVLEESRYLLGCEIRQCQKVRWRASRWLARRDRGLIGAPTATAVSVAESGAVVGGRRIRLVLKRGAGALIVCRHTPRKSAEGQCEGSVCRLDEHDG